MGARLGDPAAAISDARLEELLGRLRPVTHAPDGRLYAVRDHDPRHIAYLGFGAVPIGPPLVLVEVARFPARHHLDPRAPRPKPTIAEVLAQLPEPMPAGAIAFTTILDEPRVEGRWQWCTSVLYAERGAPGRADTLAQALGRAR